MAELRRRFEALPSRPEEPRGRPATQAAQLPDGDGHRSWSERRQHEGSCRPPAQQDTAEVLHGLQVSRTAITPRLVGGVFIDTEI